jgi:type IV secretory pathway VirJ component
MERVADDTTQDWLVPGHSRPPLIGELEQRVEEALVTARASEAAVITVGAAALDAAEQARRAAELAERASAAALDAQDRVALIVASAAPAEPAPAPASDSESMRDFSERADRLVARLRQLQRVPLGEPEASDVADRPRSES